MKSYIPSVGMEVHAELLTRSKMFSRSPVAFGGSPNTRLDPVCLGLPGALPVPNRAAIEMVLKTALALDCTIARRSVFHRKNYFYPDLPKGFQVSQYEETNPIGYSGRLEIPLKDGSTKWIRIRRVHLEEDTGKLMHMPGGGSGIDFNRAGVPLMEVVTDFPPDIASPDEAGAYLRQLRSTLMYLGVCDGKMEQGSLRCEPNISIRPEGADNLGTKTELKNLNSFKAVEEGMEFEVARQAELLDSNGEVLQETRGWNEDERRSFRMRVKESEQDYRYFPDPDLAPMELSDELIEEVRATLPELPLAKRRRYEADYALSAYDADLLTADRQWAEFFEDAVEQGGDPKAICNWMNSDFARMLNESGQIAGLTADGDRTSEVTPAHLVELVKLIDSGSISGKQAKDVFAKAFETGAMPSKIVESQGIQQISDASAIQTIVRQVIKENPDPVAQFKSGKEGAIGYLVGQAMKLSKGQANPQLVLSALRKELGE